MPSAAAWYSVAYNGSTFAALVQGATTAATSTDGATWTSRTSAGSYNWSGMYAVGGTFCAVSDGGYAQTSTDGINWTLRTLPRSHNYRLFGYFGGNQPAFLAVGGQYTAYSTNGITWTEGTLPENYQYSGAAYNGSIWMVASENLGGWVTTSTNGVNWSAKKMVPELFDIDRADKKGFYLTGPFVIGNTFYLIYNYNHKYILSTTDGNTWTRVIRKNLDPYVFDGGNGGEVLFSPPYASYASDGTTFTVINVYNVRGQYTFTTDDFLTWRRKSSPRNDTYGYAFQERNSIAVGGGKMVAVFPSGNGQSACIYGTYSSATSRP